MKLVMVAVLAVAWWRGEVDVALWFGKYRLGRGYFHPPVLLYTITGSAM
jgi:hypothetical protein